MGERTCIKRNTRHDADFEDTFSRFEFIPNNELASQIVVSDIVSETDKDLRSQFAEKIEFIDRKKEKDSNLRSIDDDLGMALSTKEDEKDSDSQLAEKIEFIDHEEEKDSNLKSIDDQAIVLSTNEDEKDSDTQHTEKIKFFNHKEEKHSNLKSIDGQAFTLSTNEDEKETQSSEKDILAQAFGIRNEGNSSFLNAALQCIFSSKKFIRYYKRKKYLFAKNEHLIKECKIDMKLQGYKFCKAMHEICSLVTRSSTCNNRVTTLRNMIKDEFPIGEQNDALKCILYIFGNLCLEVSPMFMNFISKDYDDHVQAWRGYRTMHTSIVDQLFVGMHQYNATCKKCYRVATRFEPFMHIPLDCEDDSVEDAYKRYIFDTTLPAKTSVTCEACKEESVMFVTKEIAKLPKYCLFSFNRFDYENSSKNMKFIEYPSSLYLDDKYESGMKYKLQSIVVHSDEFYGGKYTAVVRKNKEWILSEDSCIKRIKKSEAMYQQAYILLYKRIYT